MKPSTGTQADSSSSDPSKDATATTDMFPSPADAADDAIGSSNNKNNDEEPPVNYDGLQQVAEFTAKVSLAGFGGAAIGVARQAAVQRQAGNFRVVTGNAAAQAARTARSASSSKVWNLPLAWGTLCSCFVTTFEATRLWSPTRKVLTAMQSSKVLVSQDTSSSQSSTVTSPPPMSDFLLNLMDDSIGGGLAGLFSSQLANRILMLPLSTTGMQRPVRPSFGILVGAGIGMIAGSLQRIVDGWIDDLSADLGANQN